MVRTRNGYDGYWEVVVLLLKCIFVLIFGTISAIATYFFVERGILRLWPRSK